MRQAEHLSTVQILEQFAPLLVSWKPGLHPPHVVFVRQVAQFVILAIFKQFSSHCFPLLERVEMLSH